MEVKVAVYNTHHEAINALQKLAESNLPMEKISLLGKAEMIDNHIHVRSIEKDKNIPVFLGIGAGTTLGLLTGIGVFVIPGLGFLYGAGAIIGIIGGFDFGLIAGGISTILLNLGIKKDKVIKFHKHLKANKFIIIIDGSPKEIERAESILQDDGNHIELI